MVGDTGSLPEACWRTGRCRRTATTLLAHVAQAHIETWSNLGHMAHLAEPDRFAARVSHFVIDAG